MRHFKAFDFCDLELRPLTVFLGENNSGKSSILASIRLLAQTIQGPDQTIPLALSGAFGDFGSYKDIVHGNHRGRPVVLGLAFTGYLPARRSMQSYFEAEFKHRAQTRDTIIRSSELGNFIDGRRVQLVRVSTSKASTGRILLEQIEGRRIVESARATVSRDVRMYNFLPRLLAIYSAQRSRSADVNAARVFIADASGRARAAFDDALRILRSVEYLAAMRRPPERTYVNTGVIGRKIGADGSGWPSVLALESPRRRTVGHAITEWMRDAGIAESVSVAWLTDRHYEIVVTNPATGETENIADVGQGTSQVLPVLVGGSRLQRGDVFIVEEPEIHLHPRAQAALGDFFTGLVQDGVQSIVETHSEYFLLRLQQKVAAGEIEPNQICFYYVRTVGGSKEVAKLVLDETASFRDQLPGGFFPQRVDEARKLAMTRGKRSISNDS
jgi:predicted ATPase